jgi:HEPN superfamily RiboL-PSP-like protein
MPRASLTNLDASLSGVRLVLTDLAAGALHVPVSPTFFGRRTVILSSLIVTLSGYFESFLRDFAQEFAKELSRKNVPFPNLHVLIRDAHFLGGGKVLTEAVKQSSHRRSTATPIDIVERLVSVKQATYTLLWESFAETQANPGARTVTAYLKSMSVNGGFNEVARLLTVADPTQPASGNGLSTALDALIERRNECAHTGTIAQALSEQDVEAYCDLLWRLANGIAGAGEGVILAA